MSSNQQTVQKVTLWSAYFFIITAVNLLFGASLQFYNATAALYVQSLGGTATYAGTMLTIFTVSATVMRIASGRFLDKKGRCIIIAIGAAIFGAGSLSFAIPVLPWLPVARFIQGVGYSMVTTGVTVAIADVIPKQRMGEGIGYFGLVSPLSTAMGPVVALKLCGDGNFNLVFIVAAICIFFGGALTIITNYEKNVKFRERIRTMEALAPAPAAPAAAAAKPAQTGEKKSVIWTYFEKTALKPTFISLMMSLPNGAIVAFLVLYAKTVGITDASLYYTFNAIALIATRLIFGRFADRFKPVVTTAPALIIGAIGYAFLLFAGSAPALFPVAGILIGVGSGLASPTLNALVIKNAGPARRGAASATYMMSFDVGIGAGGFIWGLFIDSALGFTGVFVGCIVCMLIGCVLSCIWLREKK